MNYSLTVLIYAYEFSKNIMYFYLLFFRKFTLLHGLWSSESPYTKLSCTPRSGTGQWLGYGCLYVPRFSSTYSGVPGSIGLSQPFYGTPSRGLRTRS